LRAERVTRVAVVSTAVATGTPDRRKAINRVLLKLAEDPELPIFGQQGRADRVEFLKDSPGKLPAKLFSFKTVRYASGTALIGVGQRSTTGWEKAVNEYLGNKETEQKALAALHDLWAGLSELTPYADVLSGSVSAKELRENTYLASAGVLYAIGYAVHKAVRDHGTDVRTAVRALGSVDFNRPNKTEKITPNDTIFAGNLVDPESGKIAAGRSAWRARATPFSKASPRTRARESPHRARCRSSRATLNLTGPGPAAEG